MMFVMLFIHHHQLSIHTLLQDMNVEELNVRVETEFQFSYSSALFLLSVMNEQLSGGIKLFLMPNPTAKWCWGN
jgi:hypothetical protein